MDSTEEFIKNQARLDFIISSIIREVSVNSPKVKRYERNIIPSIQFPTIEKLAVIIQTHPLALMKWDNYMFYDYEKLTDEEQLHLVKYRALDERGKDMVDTILDAEYNY